MEKSELRTYAHHQWTSFASRAHLVPEEPVVSDETLILDVRPSPSQEVEVKLAYLLRNAGVPVSYVQSQVMVGNRFANQSFSRPWELTDPAVTDSTDPLETRNIETPDLPVVFAAAVSTGS